MMQAESSKTLVANIHIPSSIRRAADLSIAGLIESARIAILVLPILFSLPQMARAATAETVEYEVVEDAEPAQTASIARFGPFAVTNATTAELRSETDSATPNQFRAMLTAYPQIKLIRMIECAGTVDDDANLQVARMIRKAGISTHVPAGGSVRSGGVELFMAGLHHTHDVGAEFGVHSWADDAGHQARDFVTNDPVRADYIRYYQDVGLPADKATAFYAFTNATPFEQIHYMTEGELVRFGLTN